MAIQVQVIAFVFFSSIKSGDPSF